MIFKNIKIREHEQEKFADELKKRKILFDNEIKILSNTKIFMENERKKYAITYKALFYTLKEAADDIRDFLAKNNISENEFESFNNFSNKISDYLIKMEIEYAERGITNENNLL